MKWEIALLTVSLALVNAETKKECENDMRCAEDKLTRVMDQLNGEDTIRIYGDMITLEKIPVDASEVSQYETDPLLSSVDRFLQSRKIHLSFPHDGSSADLFGRALGEKDVQLELRSFTQGASEGRSKLKKILIPVLLALKLKAMIVLPIVITLIGLVGIKGLGTGLAALLISGALALKALLTPPPLPPRVSYGIIKPHDIHTHDHWHRSQEEVSEPYRGWVPEYVDQFQGYQGYQGVP
ncbi:uncharacterized protein LOC124305510 [Neodiprion virginianus]|uniref:uncharacterized protein LOC124305510 n=1 Tax=Neodiprion virginianus TaxID=2961670 RepID=UPI001EE72A1A|nr:uncharacterized protein LOC124305510 [Neodiprion virginianus]